MFDWCLGCAEADEAGRSRRLPEDWKTGDPIPVGTPVHATMREPRRFYVMFDHRRIYLDPPELWTR
jgi:hypothetical protein